MAAVDQALKEFGKIDILINCESLQARMGVSAESAVPDLPTWRSQYFCPKLQATASAQLCSF